MATEQEKNYLDENGLLFLWSKLKIMLEGKVDSVTGKSLVSNTEIERLASVINYDDAEVKKSITALQTTIKNLQESGYDDTELKKTIANTYATLANTYTKTDVYTKSEVDAKISTVYKPKGSVANKSSLPTSDVEIGWVYNCLDTGKNYVWMGISEELPDGWDDLGGLIDLTDYVQSDNLKALTNEEIQTILAM